MKCFLCGKGERVKKISHFPFESKVIGKINVPDIEYIECLLCHEKRISLAMSKKVSAYVMAKEKQAIGTLPIDNFITADEAAALIGFTKQAFSKHKAVKNGLLYCTEKGKRKLYDRESVKLFCSNKRDGRYLITSHNPREIIAANIFFEQTYETFVRANHFASLQESPEKLIGFNVPHMQTTNGYPQDSVENVKFN